MSLKTHAGRIAVGVALMVGPIIGCDDDDDYYPYYGSSGSVGSSSGFTSSSGYDYVDGGKELCESVKEGVACRNQGNQQPICEQGTSANANCNPRLICNHDNVWEEEEPQRSVCAPASACPSAYTESAPDLCKRPDAKTLLCEYDEGTCGCAVVGGFVSPTDPGGDDDDDDDDVDAGDAGDAGVPTDAGPTLDAGTRTYEWKCIPPPTDEKSDASCPRRRPREGIDCVRPLLCDYGYCLFEDGFRMNCTGGSWARDLPKRSHVCDQ